MSLATCSLLCLSRSHLRFAKMGARLIYIYQLTSSENSSIPTFRPNVPGVSGKKRTVQQINILRMVIHSTYIFYLVVREISSPYVKRNLSQELEKNDGSNKTSNCQMTNLKHILSQSKSLLTHRSSRSHYFCYKYWIQTLDTPR